VTYPRSLKTHGSALATEANPLASKNFTQRCLQDLPKDRMILLKTGLPPVLAHRLAYFQDPELAGRADRGPKEFRSGRPDVPPPLPKLSGDSASRDSKGEPPAEEPEADRDDRGRSRDDERQPGSTQGDLWR
jgi:type IV secretory pathway TraG/TraD family ATPase VirD4